MTGDLPPPTGPPPPGPPPGWYADPTTGVGYRWWDGQGWTAQTAPSLPGRVRSAGSLVPLGDWFRSVLQLARSRAGHIFTLTVVLLVPTSVAWGMVSWYQYREAVLIIPEEGDPRWSGVIGGPGWVAASVATWILLMVANLLLMAAVADQTATTLGDSPTLWSGSLRAGLRRFLPVLGTSLVGAGGTFVLVVVALVLVAVVPPVGALVGLAVLIAAVGFAVCLAPAPVIAAVGPRGASPVRASVAAVRSAFWPVVGRLAFLGGAALVTSMMVSFLGQPIALLAGASTDPELEFTGERYPFGPWFFDASPAVTAISQVFSALGSGAALAVWVVGLTVLYRDLGGAIEIPESDATADGAGTASA